MHNFTVCVIAIVKRVARWESFDLFFSVVVVVLLLLYIQIFVILMKNDYFIDIVGFYKFLAIYMFDHFFYLIIFAYCIQCCNNYISTGCGCVLIVPVLLVCWSVHFTCPTKNKTRMCVYKNHSPRSMSHLKVKWTKKALNQLKRKMVICVKRDLAATWDITFCY